MGVEGICHSDVPYHLLCDGTLQKENNADKEIHVLLGVHVTKQTHCQPNIRDSMCICTHLSMLKGNISCVPSPPPPLIPTREMELTGPFSFPWILTPEVAKLTGGRAESYRLSLFPPCSPRGKAGKRMGDKQPFL